MFGVRRFAFTLLELLIVVIVIMIVAALLVGSVMRSQQEARYTRWLGYSRDLRTDADIIAYYDFEEGEGSTLENVAFGDPGDIDYRPPDFNGSIHGAQWRRDEGRWVGKFGLLFDGVDDYVALGLQARKGEFDNLTVLAWVKPARDADQAVISLDGNENWELGFDAVGGSLAASWVTTDRNGSTAPMTTSPAYGIGNWYLLVGWYSSDGILMDSKIYVNGEQVAGAKKHDGEALGAGVARDITFGYIGVDSQAASRGGDHGSRFFAGVIDEIVVFKRVLTDAEITDFYRMGGR